MSNAEILVIKIGQVQSLTFADGSCYESAIRKQPVEVVNIHSLGAEGNDVGLKAHHGGVDKALFFMSADSFPALNALLDENFSYQGTAVYGENFVVSEFNERLNAGANTSSAKACSNSSVCSGADNKRFKWRMVNPGCGRLNNTS